MLVFEQVNTRIMEALVCDCNFFLILKALLFQDDIGGLEVLPKQSEKWIPVAPVKDAILVNIGDLMMRYKLWCI